MKKSIIALLTLLLLTACATQPKGLAAFVDKSAQQIYAQGTKMLDKGKYKQAVEHFEALDAMYPFSPYTQQAQLHMIYAYYKSDDFPSALAASDRYIHLYPRICYARSINICNSSFYNPSFVEREICGCRLARSYNCNC